MLRRILSGAAAVLAAGLCVAGSAAAGTLTVTFEDQVFNAIAFPDTYNTRANQFSEHGLRFEGEQFYFLPAGNPDVTAPAAYASTFMEEGLEPVTIGRVGGGLFDLLSLDLALGAANGNVSDSVTITGVGACAPTCQTTVGVNDQGFDHFDLTGFTGLTGVTVSMPQYADGQGHAQTDTGFLAFDNIKFSAAGVPEPAEWLLLMGGLLASGYMLRRARQLAAVEPELTRDGVQTSG